MSLNASGLSKWCTKGLQFRLLWVRVWHSGCSPQSPVCFWVTRSIDSYNCEGVGELHVPPSLNRWIIWLVNWGTYTWTHNMTASQLRALPKLVHALPLMPTQQTKLIFRFPPWNHNFQPSLISWNMAPKHHAIMDDAWKYYLLRILCDEQGRNEEDHQDLF